MVYSKKAYTPQISMVSSKILRRLAWFENKPMTTTMDSIILEYLQLVNLKEVCKSCKVNGTECENCPILRIK